MKSARFMKGRGDVATELKMNCIFIFIDLVVKECSSCSSDRDASSREKKLMIATHTFGPVPVSDVVGRVIYGLQSPNDHDPIKKNSEKSMEEDLDVELGVNEMVASSFSYSMKERRLVS
ncbi:Mitochondrial ATP-independent inner membrane protease subunit 2-like protein [Drosera capensis]